MLIQMQNKNMKDQVHIPQCICLYIFRKDLQVKMYQFEHTDHDNRPDLYNIILTLLERLHNLNR